MRLPWIVCFWAIVVCHAAEPVACPPAIQVSEQPQSRRLVGITFFDGPPEEKASLVYDTFRRAGKTDVAEWTFAPQAKRGFWLSCAYEATSAVRARQLPPDTRTCSVIYDAKKKIEGLPLILKIACQ